MSLYWQKQLGYGGQRHPWRRGPSTWIARRLARRSGGLVFLEDERLFDEILGSLGLRPRQTLAAYRREVLEHRALRSAFDRARAEGRPVEDPSWEAHVARLSGILTVYYALLREVAPEVVVETGTAAGEYTAFLLAALDRNARGRLVSIDIPPVAGRLTMDYLTLAPEEIGYFVPAELRARWEYREGDAKVLLPRVMLEEPVDVFVHDSLHTRTHMLFEYSVARALMGEGKLIVSDDIMWNCAFQDFLAAHRLSGFSPYANPNLGLCVNRFDEFERRAGLGVWKGSSERSRTVSA